MAVRKPKQNFILPYYSPICYPPTHTHSAERYVSPIPQAVVLNHNSNQTIITLLHTWWFWQVVGVMCWGFGRVSTPFSQLWVQLQPPLFLHTHARTCVCTHNLYPSLSPSQAICCFTLFCSDLHALEKPNLNQISVNCSYTRALSLLMRGKIIHNSSLSKL